MKVFSIPSFTSALVLYCTACSPSVGTAGAPEHKDIVLTAQQPEAVSVPEGNVILADFGKDAFCQLTLDLETETECIAKVRLGEKLDNGRIDRTPPGTVRYAEYELALSPGRNEYKLELRRDPRNTKTLRIGNPLNEPPILMPEDTGEVYPFRYVEVEGKGIEYHGMVRHMAHYPFNDGASYFHSSDSVLNAVWELARYSIKATSFCGIYVDGDRERIPYEADALINQMCHYGVDAEYGMARASLDFLIDHATWPTEWLLQTPLIAWNDYMYTGDKSLLECRYDDLAAKTLIPLRDSTGLISTVGGISPELADAVHFRGAGGPVRDIVDWPRVGGFGAPGEDDSYEYTAHNTVVNAYHAKALECMSMIAAALGRKDDAKRFSSLAEETVEALNSLCFNSGTGAYNDGAESCHNALHASLFPLAFGYVPKDRLASVLTFIESKGMACSVYAAHFLLEGLYDAGDARYALSLLTSTSDRSWYNMIREGSTITMEAWAQKYKPNQDWNHAWGAAPASAIPHKLIGIEPLKPGGRIVRVKPQPGGLDSAEALVPTPLGGVKCSFEKLADGRYRYCINVPEGVKARIEIAGKRKITRDAGEYVIYGD